MSLVVGESVIVTAVAGYCGLVLGIFVVELAARYMKDVPFLRQPDVNLSLALTATAILVSCGALAGFFPARHAASVSPIEALRG